MRQAKKLNQCVYSSKSKIVFVVHVVVVVLVVPVRPGTSSIVQRKQYTQTIVYASALSKGAISGASGPIMVDMIFPETK
jgi:hypothetical protein